MLANDDFLDMAVGDEFRFAEAGVHGLVDSIHYDDANNPGAIVVKGFDGLWYTVDLSKIERVKASVH